VFFLRFLERFLESVLSTSFPISLSSILRAILTFSKSKKEIPFWKRPGRIDHVTTEQAQIQACEKNARTRVAKQIRDDRNLPIQRNFLWRERFPDGARVPRNFAHHPSHGPAGILQLYGNFERAGEDRCAKCVRGNGPFEECVSFDPRLPLDGYSEVPFGGACANCFWDGQGSGCNKRVAGGK